jgi:hypothetical protein
MKAKRMSGWRIGGVSAWQRNGVKWHKACRQSMASKESSEMWLA